jgi:hypothetical protein
MPARHLSLEEISDRIQIGDLLTRYTTAIDTKDYVLLDSVFTPDAQVDYTSSGGIAGDYPTARDWLERALSLFPVTVHFISNSTVELRGDEASARTYVINPMLFKNPDERPHLHRRRLLQRSTRPHGRRLAHPRAHRGAGLPRRLSTEGPAGPQLRVQPGRTPRSPGKRGPRQRCRGAGVAALGCHPLSRRCPGSG